MALAKLLGRESKVAEEKLASATERLQVLKAKQKDYLLEKEEEAGEQLALSDDVKPAKKTAKKKTAKKVAKKKAKKAPARKTVTKKKVAKKKQRRKSRILWQHQKL